MSSPWLNELTAAADGVASEATLPDYADVVIVGAGMTGCSLAYHLCTMAAGETGEDDLLRGGASVGIKSVVCIDGRCVAGGASGRNGGIMWPCTDEPFEMRKQFIYLLQNPCQYILFCPSTSVIPLLLNYADARGTPRTLLKPRHVRRQARLPR